MTESSFSCGLSSEMSECSVSVRYEWTSRLTLGMPITTDTAGAEGQLGTTIGPRPSPSWPCAYLRCGPGPRAQPAAGCFPWPAGAASGGRQWAGAAQACAKHSTASGVGHLGGSKKDRSERTGDPATSPASLAMLLGHSPVRRPQVRLPSRSRSTCLSDTALLISSSTRLSSLERLRLSCSAACNLSRRARNSRWYTSTTSPVGGPHAVTRGSRPLEGARAHIYVPTCVTAIYICSHAC